MAKLWIMQTMPYDSPGL